MSGHSHWHSIKHKKGAADAKKSKVFSKISREITIAAKEGGGDTNFNPKLRMILEKAKNMNMSSENMERAIKRGTGELEGVNYEKVMFEAYGPGNTALIIEGITDNKKRSLSEVKQILNQHGGKLVGEGAVKWMFEMKGCLSLDVENQEKRLDSKEEWEMAAIDSGAEDISWDDNLLNVYTKPDRLYEVKKTLEEKGLKTERASLDWVPKEYVQVSEKEKESCEKLFEALDESDSVQEIYSNLES